MISASRVTLVFVAAAIAAGLIAAGCAALNGFRKWRRKNPEEIERLRRLGVNRTGRITSGQIVDLVEDAEKKRRIVVYQYEVGGVTYEASQEISGLAEFPTAGVAGLISSIKYDRHKPMNSIVACEGWNGLTVSSRAGEANKAVISDE